MKLRRVLFLLFFPLIAFSQISNVKITDIPDNMFAEPSVIVNHKNTQYIAMATGGNTVFVSDDGGKTWKKTNADATGADGSPTLIYDAKGRLYLFRAAHGKEAGSDLDHLICQRSEDDGQNWNEGSVIGLNPPKRQQFQTVNVNPRKQVLYTVWAQYDEGGMGNPKCQSNLFFSQASNAGNKWDKPVALNQLVGDCSMTANSISIPGIVIGIDSRIYAVWSLREAIFFDRSYDEGATWLHNDLPIAQQPAGWVHAIPSLGNVNHSPLLLIDNSADRYHGMLYLIFSDQRNGANDSDIWLHRSTKHGDSWATAVRINKDEPGKQQFSPAGAVDQTSGALYVIYLDRRESDGNATHVYVARSRDGGATFADFRISETPFNSSETSFSTRFTSIASHGGVIAATWIRSENGKLSVWGAFFQESELVVKK